MSPLINPLTGRGAPQSSRPQGFVKEVDSSKRRRPFEKNVADMMYGFGDEKAPQPESVAIIEDIVCDFVTRMTMEAAKLSAKRGKKLVLEDILLLVRKHPQMYYRAQELIRKDKEITNAKGNLEAKKLEKEIVNVKNPENT